MIKILYYVLEKENLYEDFIQYLKGGKINE